MAEEGTAERTLLKTLRATAQFLGIVGGGGAGFTAVAFGIGYLATKHHDAMLGMPTTTTDQTTYVRTGALFFTQSLHDLVAVLALLARPLWRTLLAGVAVALAVWVGRWLTMRPASAWRWAPVAAGWAALALVATSYLPRHLAPLDAANKNLLFEQRPAADSAAAHVNALLRKADAEQDLHHEYGVQWAILMALGLAAFVLWTWRPAIAETAAVAGPSPGERDSRGKEGPGRMLAFPKDFAQRGLPAASNWVFQPAALIAISAILLTMPANYGVLAVSPSLPCVQLYAAPKDAGSNREFGLPGFLISDLSSESAKIAILRWDTDRRSYFVDLHPRDSLYQLEVRRCGVRNPVSRVLGGSPQSTR